MRRILIVARRRPRAGGLRRHRRRHHLRPRRPPRPPRPCPVSLPDSGQDLAAQHRRAAGTPAPRAERSCVLGQPRGRLRRAGPRHRQRDLLRARPTQAVDRSFDLEPDENFAALAASAADLRRPPRLHRGPRRSADAALAINPRRPRCPADPRRRPQRARPLRRPAQGPAQRRTGCSRAPRSRPATPTPRSCAATSTGALDILRSAAAAGSRADHAYTLTLLADIERKRRRLPAAGRDLAVALQAAPDLPAGPRLPGPPAGRPRRPRRCRPDLAGRRRPPAAARSTSPSSASCYVHLGRTDEAEAQFAVVRTTIELLDAERGEHRPRGRAVRGRPRLRRPGGQPGPRRVGPAHQRPRRRRARLGAAPRRPRPRGAPDRARATRLGLPGGEVLDPPRDDRGRARA